MNKGSHGTMKPFLTHILRIPVFGYKKSWDPCSSRVSQRESSGGWKWDWSNLTYKAKYLSHWTWRRLWPRNTEGVVTIKARTVVTSWRIPFNLLWTGIIKSRTHSGKEIGKSPTHSCGKVFGLKMYLKNLKEEIKLNHAHEIWVLKGKTENKGQVSAET